MKKIFTFIAAALMTVAASAQVISFSEAASAGSLNGQTLGTDFTLTVTDTGSKVSVDANSVLFGTAANDTIRFAYRMKTGGKSSAKSLLTLVVPTDGTLKVYARTGSNSATDRNFVVAIGTDTIINHTCVEAYDSLKGGVGGKKCYLPVSAEVTAGTYTITYPTASINFYGFELATPTKLNATSLEGSYKAKQYASAYLGTDYASSAYVDTTYTTTVKVDDNTATIKIYDGKYNFNLSGTIDVDAQTITIEPTTKVMNWYTVAGSTAATDNIVATYKLDGDSIRISFPKFNVWYNGSAYDYYSSLELAGKYVAKSKDWSTEANIKYYSKSGLEIYSGKCNIARYTGYSYKYQVTNYGNSEISQYTKAVNFNETADGLTLDYSNAYNNYFYYVLQSNDDMWMEGGALENKTAVVGTDDEGSLTWYYWQYDTSATGYPQINEGNVVVSWPYVAPTAVNTVNANVNVNKVVKTPNYIIKNGKKYNYAGQLLK